MATLPLAPATTGYVPTGSSGGVAPLSLLEVLTRSNTLYLWSEANLANMPSVIAGTSSNLYRGWLVGQAKFSMMGSTQTDTGSLSVQNLSGNSVQRDVALAFSRDEFIGAYVYYRLWRADAEIALFSFSGNVVEVDVDETQMDLSIESFGNWSQIQAPSDLIDVACPLFFGSPQCGSTASTPCQNSYGSCSSIERFKGVLIQWDSTNLLPAAAQVAQPAPGVAQNTARSF